MRLDASPRWHPADINVHARTMTNASGFRRFILGCLANLNTCVTDRASPRRLQSRIWEGFAWRKAGDQTSRQYLYRTNLDAAADLSLGAVCFRKQKQDSYRRVRWTAGGPW